MVYSSAQNKGMIKKKKLISEISIKSTPPIANLINVFQVVDKIFWILAVYLLS